MTFLTEWLDVGTAKKHALAAVGANYPDWECRFAFVDKSMPNGWLVRVLIWHAKLKCRVVWMSVSRYACEAIEVADPPRMGPERS
jgi:hypothetical protein